MPLASWRSRCSGRSPTVVFAANAFALLELRPLFFLVSGLLDRLVYMTTGLAIVLGFIGIKLILEFAHNEDHRVPELSTATSLAVILTVLAITTIASMIESRRHAAVRAHAGALRRRPQAEEERGTISAVQGEPV